MATDRRLKENLERLLDIQDPRGLAPVPARGAVPPRRGYEEGEEPQAPPSGGGIASPLTEPDIEAREYYDSQLLTSSDGLFTLEIAPIKKLVMEDAGQAEVVFEFADPDPEEE